MCAVEHPGPWVVCIPDESSPGSHLRCLCGSPMLRPSTPHTCLSLSPAGGMGCRGECWRACGGAGRSAHTWMPRNSTPHIMRNKERNARCTPLSWGAPVWTARVAETRGNGMGVSPRIPRSSVHVCHAPCDAGGRLVLGGQLPVVSPHACCSSHRSMHTEQTPPAGNVIQVPNRAVISRSDSFEGGGKVLGVFRRRLHGSTNQIGFITPSRRPSPLSRVCSFHRGRGAGVHPWVSAQEDERRTMAEALVRDKRLLPHVLQGIITHLFLLSPHFSLTSPLVLPAGSVAPTMHMHTHVHRTKR